MGYTYDLNMHSNPILPDVKVFFIPEFRDHRGTYRQTYDVFAHTEKGCPKVFVQDCFATSGKGVLRGIHGDATTWKLIQCTSGAFFLAVVDNRKDSPTYLQTATFTLREQSRIQVLVPPGFGNGHYILTKKATFHYKQSTPYDRDSQFTLRWDDPKLRIPWPLLRGRNTGVPRMPILSERDATAPFLL